MTMTNDRLSGKPDSKSEREARLAAQLRENLKRRKAQARARAKPDGSTEPDDGDGAAG